MRISPRLSHVRVRRDEHRERNRIKIRVRTAMAARAKDEGRFLGGARGTGT